VTRVDLVQRGVPVDVALPAAVAYDPLGAMVKSSLKVRPVPLTELDSQTADLVRQVHEHAEPVVLTRGGRRLAVVLSAEAFDHMLLQQSVEQADAAIESGEYVSNDEVMAELDRWAADGIAAGIRTT
jgi:prevent-host-death family protein